MSDIFYTSHNHSTVIHIFTVKNLCSRNSHTFHWSYQFFWDEMLHYQVFGSYVLTQCILLLLLGHFYFWRQDHYVATYTIEQNTQWHIITCKNWYLIHTTAKAYNLVNIWLFVSSCILWWSAIRHYLFSLFCN